jgi:carbamoyl-phosphate synthase large subunit
MALSEAGVLERHDVRLLGRRSRRSAWPRTARRSANLLDRINQPYAPSAIVEGLTPADREQSAREALAEIGLPAIVRPAFTLGGTAVGSSGPRRPTGSASAPAFAPARSDQVMVERCLVGWQEVEYEVMRDADDTCIAVCSM